MKSILLLIAVLFAVNGMAQDAVATKTNIVLSDLSNKNTTFDELAYMRSCLNKYYKMRQSAYFLAGTSIVLAGASFGIKEENNRNGILTAAGASAILSSIVFISAEKWLKRSSLKPSESGIGIKFEF